MLRTWSAVILFSVLLMTASSAQNCGAVGQQLASTYREWQAALAANSEAATAYSACAENQAREHCHSETADKSQYSECLENQARPESQQAREHCQNTYSNLQFAKHNLQAAVSEYESWRQDSCVQQPGPAFGRIPPLGVWPPAE
jgi:hypothetical protein